MFDLIKQHPTLASIAAFYLFSNAVQYLPTPAENSNAFYRWFFGFSHGLAGNVRFAMQKAFPQFIQAEGGEHN